MGTTSEISYIAKTTRDERMTYQTKDSMDSEVQAKDIDREDLPTLVIDTSFGSTVGIVGHRAIIESDSRSHVEKLQPNIARATREAGIDPHQIARIIVGTGPAPFTGLRAGIVAAKALAYANGAELIGQNILEVQHQWMKQIHQCDQAASDSANTASVHATLAVNDARRHQLYYALYVGEDELLPMDIDFPEAIVTHVSDCLTAAQTTNGKQIDLDIVGHGAGRYMQEWSRFPQLQSLDQVSHDGAGVTAQDEAFAVSSIRDESVLDQNPDGIRLFAQTAIMHAKREQEVSAEPLYLRRPDVSVPKPLKQVTYHEESSSGARNNRTSSAFAEHSDARGTDGKGTVDKDGESR